MNRRARRRAAQRAAHRPPRARRPLPRAARLVLSVAGVGLIVFAVALAASGSAARGGRLIGAIALIGAALIAIAWQGKV